MNYDSIVIGFGKAGKTLAGYKASKGEKVAIIEKSTSMYGGTCINVGCIPSKSLITSAIRRDKTQSLEQAKEYYSNSIARKNKLVQALRKKNYDKLNNLSNVDVIDGVASFVDNNTILVNGTTLSAKNIYINTGSTSFIPQIEGLKDNPYIFNSESLMDLDTLPEQLVILGGGYIGLEFASMYANFGSKVKVLVDTNDFLPREDTDVALSIKEALQNMGVEIILGTKVISINNNSVRYKVNDIDVQISFDAMLVATGRRPNIAALHLENTDVKLTERNAIKVNDKLQTSVDHIYAMGDVVGGLQFTYISLDDFRIISNEQYDLSARKNVPYSVFIDPSYSRVGINEIEAKQLNLNYQVVTLPVNQIPKAHVLGKTTGMLKALVDNDTNKILGAMLFMEESYEIINFIKLAMDLDADYTVIKNFVFTHPTMSESLNDLFSLFKK